MKWLKIDLQKWFVCHWYCWIHHRYEEFLAFILLFLYNSWFLFMWNHNTCQIWWWFLNFPVEILKHECWFCPDLGGVHLCLELETGCKKNGSTKLPIILVLIFAVSSSFEILPLPFLILFAFPGDTGAECPPSRLHVLHLFPGPALCQALSVPPGRCCARPRVPDWKMEVTRHRVGCRNLLGRLERCSLGYYVHVCSEKAMKIPCDYRVEVLVCRVVPIDCCLLAASRTSSFFMSYYYCYLGLKKINWYHFKGKQRDSLQLCCDPRAGFGLSHLYTSMFQDWLFLD